MAPTIHQEARQARSRGSSEKRSELACRVKYNNTLPDIPFDAKYIVYPFDANRYVQYNPTSLERSCKFELLTEHDLGVPIDLIDPDAYKIDPNAQLSIEDEYLLEDEVNIPIDPKRPRHNKQSVTWLRKTEYISTEYNRFAQSANRAEARVGFNIKKQLKDDLLYKDRESQIKAINDTFEFAMKPITQHYSKPGVEPLEILPIFPDFEMWKHPCAQVIFDSDPASKDKSVAVQNEEMSQAMIRGMVDESGDQFVAYFLPTPETTTKRKRDVEAEVSYGDDDEYDYILAREYNWNVKNKASRGYEENYFFVIKDDGVYYNELETRVRLSKRRKIGTSATAVAKSRLIVKHRPFTDQEIAAHDARAMALEPAGDEDDVDAQKATAEDEDGDDEDADANKKRNDDANNSDDDVINDDDDDNRKSDDETTEKERSRSRIRSGSRSGSPSPRRSVSPAQRSRSASPSAAGSDNERDGNKDKEEIFGSASSGEESE